MKFTFISLGALGIMLLSWWLFENPIKTTVVYQAARTEVAVEVATGQVFFLGDIMLARDVEIKLKRQPFSFAFAEMDYLQEATAVVGNFEASIPTTHEPTPSMVMKFSVDPVLLEVLSGHITHLSLANNHALDYGANGYANSVVELEKWGMETFGHPTRIDNNSISYIEVANRNMAVIGFNATYGDLNEAWEKVLAEASLSSDIQVAYIHWGEEYELFHEARQSEVGRQLIDSGFELVIGHHPHVVQDIERYGNGLIVYSLGNFLFDQYWNNDVATGLVVELNFDGTKSSLLLHPVESISVRVQPRLMLPEEKVKFLEELAARSSPDLMADIRQGVIPLQF